MASGITSSAKDEKKTKSFTCSLCSFTVDYHYFGNKPPFARALTLHEDCYIIKDPFQTSGGMINIGSVCSLCNAVVCMSTDCSLFYSKRFCIPCVIKHLDQFPDEIQQELSKRQQGD